jgi:hypothetical protein
MRRESVPLEPVSMPNFFLVGASKAGTTSLYHYLAQHPQIFMSPIKEPHFLADEVRKENFDEEKREKIERWELALRQYLQGTMAERFPSGPVSDWPDYLTLFQFAGDRPAIGEASPCYLWSKTAPRNIAARFPGAKVVMVLRNPAERAFAQHLHTLSFASAPISFREHMEMALRSTTRQIGELYPFLEFGLYGEQVERYLNLFERDRIRIFLYEEFENDPLSMMRNIFRFLRVDETFVPDMSERHMTSGVPRSFVLRRFLRQSGAWRVASAVPPGLRRMIRPAVLRPRATMTLEPFDRARLVDLYRDDIQKLSTLLGRNLSGWLDGAFAGE